MSGYYKKYTRACSVASAPYKLHLTGRDQSYHNQEVSDQKKLHQNWKILLMYMNAVVMLDPTIYYA
jgi:hypothetical protein